MVGLGRPADTEGYGVWFSGDGRRRAGGFAAADARDKKRGEAEPKGETVNAQRGLIPDSVVLSKDRTDKGG